MTMWEENLQGGRKWETMKWPYFKSLHSYSNMANIVVNAINTHAVSEKI